MTFFQMLLMFGVPLAAFLALSIWKDQRREKKGWRSRVHSGSHSSNMDGILKLPEESQEPSSSLHTNVQDEIAAIARLSAKPFHSSPVVSSLSRTGMFNLPGRWEIRYVDAYGEETSRTIRILHLDLRAMEITAFCEARKAERTFKIRNIRRARDAVTGAGVNIAAYVEKVRAERRVQRGKFG